MNQAFEDNIKQIQKIYKKRILITWIIIILFLLLASILTFFYSEYILYIIFLYIIAILTFIIQLIFNQANNKLNSLLNTYQNNPEEVKDYLAILIQNAKNNQHNFIMKSYYHRIITYYIKALEALKLTK